MLDVELDFSEVKTAFKKALRNLDEHIPTALRLGADVVAEQARRVHDYQDQDGELTRSIMADDIQGTFENGDLEISVSAGAPHALPIEEGSRPHTIHPKFRQILRWPIEGGFQYAKEVKHPGNRPYRYLQNAYEVKEPEIVEFIEDATALAFEQAGFARI